jgi:predicted GNAT family acetyltransferase
MLSLLDRNLLAQIPTVDGKFYIGGPYTFEDLLQEPNEETEKTVDSRKLQLPESENILIRSGLIEVTRKIFSKKVTICPYSSGQITFETRYLFRPSGNCPIEGVVTLHVTYFLYGVLEKYASICKKVIHEVYVKPSSRGQGIARILLNEVLSDAPDVEVSPYFSADGARLFGFDALGNRTSASQYEIKT